MGDEENRRCSREGCTSELPADGEKIPDGWTVARLEEYKKKTISTYYLYLCPNEKLTASPKQTTLFPET